MTPLAAAALIVTMVVATLTVHLKNGFFAQTGGYEFNLALAGRALTLLCSPGPGPSASTARWALPPS